MTEDDAKKTFNGTETFCRLWKPATDEPKCLVFISHGFGEHCDRYGDIVELLGKENMLIFSHDHKGFGRSGGRRAWIENIDADMAIPIKLHIEEVRARYPGKKVFLYAHSMGGLVAARLMELHPDLVNGVVMEAPFLGLQGNVPNWQLKAMRFVGRHFGSLPIANIDTRYTCRDVKVVQDFMKDPLAYHRAAPARSAATILDALQEAFKNANAFVAPLLICHGDADRLTAASGSEAFVKLAGSTDKTFKSLPGGYHQLRSELEDVRQPFLSTVVEWINARC